MNQESKDIKENEDSTHLIGVGVALGAGLGTAIGAWIADTYDFRHGADEKQGPAPHFSPHGTTGPL